MGYAIPIQVQQTFVTVDCYKCGVVFAVDRSLDSNWKRDKTQFYCPNGHPQSYSENEADRLRKELENQKRETEWQRNRATSLDKQLVAQKGVVTKLKKRVAVGVCPCCHRTFKELAAHMQTKHPEFVADAAKP